jgi:hypothetical protein
MIKYLRAFVIKSKKNMEKSTVH